MRDDMTLDEVLDLFDYWRESPPVQWMVQGYLGIRPRSAPVATGEVPPIPQIPFKP